MSSMPSTSTSDSSGAASKNSVTVEKLANDFWMGTDFLAAVGMCLLALTCRRLASTSFLLALVLFVMAMWNTSLKNNMKEEEAGKAAAEAKSQEEAEANAVAEAKAAAEEKTQRQSEAKTAAETAAKKEAQEQAAVAKKAAVPEADAKRVAEEKVAAELAARMTMDREAAERRIVWQLEDKLAKRKGKKQPGKEHCWDFDSGYCWRGSRCKYKHDVAMAVDQSEVDSHHRACSDFAVAHGVNLSSEALNELKTLSIEDAETIIKSLGSGGAHEKVRDKNGHVIGTIRRMRMRSAADAHPNWHLQISPAKRRRYG